MVLAGHKEAFAELIYPYRQSILRLAYRLTGDQEEAFDVAQETFLRSFRYLRRFDLKRSFRNWLFQIATNAARDLIRRQRKENDGIAALAVSIYQQKEGVGTNTLAVESGPKLTIHLRACLSSLSPKERQVFILRDLEGLSIKETASVLSSSSISVRVNLARARRKIREMLEKNDILRRLES